MLIAEPLGAWYSAPMGNRLFVGNLPFHATEDMVQAAFKECGEIVEVALVLDRVSGRSRGFAFVEMATPEGAAKAIETLDGQDLGGRPLKVNQAEERKGGGGGGRSERPRRW